jgi:hypothetical protein
MGTNLSYLKTWTINEFKQEHEVSKIEVLRNEATQKCFFAFGKNGRGACSKQAVTGDLTKSVISQVCSDNTGETFLLLHQRGENGGATVLAVL